MQNVVAIWGPAKQTFRQIWIMMENVFKWNGPRPDIKSMIAEDGLDKCNKFPAEILTLS